MIWNEYNNYEDEIDDDDYDEDYDDDNDYTNEIVDGDNYDYDKSWRQLQQQQLGQQ